jgi:hypothetical protein
MTKTKEIQLDLLSSEFVNNGHGGSRTGSGRKKGEGSKLIRVPTSLIDQVEMLITKHRNDK